jgi:formyl-CoA transferase
MLAEYEHPAFGNVRSVGLPLTLGGFTPAYRRGPALGEHGDDILSELGFDPEAIETLRSNGAFGVTTSTGEPREEPG